MRYASIKLREISLTADNSSSALLFLENGVYGRRMEGNLPAWYFPQEEVFYGKGKAFSTQLSGRPRNSVLGAARELGWNFDGFLPTSFPRKK